MNINKSDLINVGMAINTCGYPKVIGAWQRILVELETALNTGGTTAMRYTRRGVRVWIGNRREK